MVKGTAQRDFNADGIFCELGPTMFLLTNNRFTFSSRQSKV